MWTWICLVFSAVTSISFQHVDGAPSPAPQITEYHKKKLADHFTSYGVSCIREHPITFEDIRALRQFQLPKSKESACFFACVMKKADLMDSEGKLKVESVVSVAQSIFDKEEDLNSVLQTFQACAYVNDAEVRDGNKGCERAMLTLSCLVKQSNSPDDETEDVDVSKSNVPQSKMARSIIEEIFSSLLQLSCSGIGIVKDFFPMKLLSSIIPLDTATNLCSLIMSI